MKNDRYGVVIIGGGPAGAVFARELACARPDLRVLLIDGQSQTRKKPCGGLLAPDAQKVLAKFDLTLPKDILADPQIFAVETVDIASKQIRYYQRHYLNMDRYAFDKWLLSLVPDGVEMISARCTDITEVEDGYEIGYIQNGTKQTVRADRIIGADGGGSLVRRRLIGNMPKQYTAIQEHYPAAGQKTPYYSCIFDRVTSDSCSWTIHKDGFVIFGGAFEKSGCREMFEQQKARFEEMAGTKFGDAVKREACLVTSPRRFSDFNCGKESVYLLGEAAGFISSSSFEGISSAIISGKLLAKAFADGKNDRHILRNYKRSTLPLRLKLLTKIFKRKVLCSPILRFLILKSGIQSIEKY